MTREGWATCVFALIELWALISEHSGVAGAWRLTGVCKAARDGAMLWLRSLPGLVVCGGLTGKPSLSEEVITSDVWRLDLSELRWKRLPSLELGRARHACCAVRGGLIVLGGSVRAEARERQVHTLSVEIFGFDSSAARNFYHRSLPPLDCGDDVSGAVAVAIDEIESAQGQVLLIGGLGRLGQYRGWAALLREDFEQAQMVRKVDIATGVCTEQASLPDHPEYNYQGTPKTVETCSAGRLPDGRIICTTRSEIKGDPYSEDSLDDEGDLKIHFTPVEFLVAQVCSPSEASEQWRISPDGRVAGRSGSTGCTLSDGRFAVFGGIDFQDYDDIDSTSSCEALTLDVDGWRLQDLPSMHDARSGKFASSSLVDVVCLHPSYMRRSLDGGDAFRAFFLMIASCTRWVAGCCENITTRVDDAGTQSNQLLRGANAKRLWMIV